MNMLKLLLTLVSLIITLTLVIGLHELGHALAAHYFSIRIKRISIGFGKPLCSYKSQSGCEWIWARWPLGGYVELLNTRIHPVDKKQWPEAFDKRPIFQRMIVLISGSLFNLLTAWVCLVGFYLLGHHYPLAVIKQVTPNGLAAAAHFQEKDQIVAINHHPIHSWEEANVSLIALMGTTQAVMEVKTNAGQYEQREIDLRHVTFKPTAHSLWDAIGITPSPKFKGWRAPEPIHIAMKSATLAIIHFVLLFLVIMKQLVLGHLPFSLLVGPFGLLALNLSAFLHGFGAFIYFIATFSMAVAVLNLLPLPGLDGCSLLYAAIEKIRGKPMSVAYEILFYQLTMIAFALLLVQLMLNDLKRFI
jgi:regulator of sigma E protease